MTNYDVFYCIRKNREATENALKNGHAWDCLIIHNEGQF